MTQTTRGRALPPAPYVEEPQSYESSECSENEVKLREALERLQLSRKFSEGAEKGKDVLSPLPLHCLEKGSQASIATPRSMKMRHVLHGELRAFEQELQVLAQDLDISGAGGEEDRRRTAACKVAQRIRSINELLDIDMPTLQKDTHALTKDLESLRDLVRTRSVSPASSPAVSRAAMSPPVPQ